MTPPPPAGGVAPGGPAVPAQRHVPKHAAKESGDGPTALADPADPADPAVTAGSAAPPPVGVDILQSRPARFEGPRLWLRRPAGRAVIAGVALALVLGGAYASGQFLVPAVAEPQAGASAPPPPSATPGAIETGEAPEPLPPTPSFTPPAGTKERPSDALAPWAGPRAVKLGIPPVSMQAYGYAELITTRNTPTCKLTWTTLAGIAKIESDHGRHNGTLVQEDGKSMPPIIGAPLDGQGNRQAIKDTDGGVLDTDRTWDRAVGPMQFLPAVWKEFGVDGDADGVTDINDIDDASLAAATKLCSGGRDLSTLEGWNAAVRAYNPDEKYRTDVFNATNDYGWRDRTG